MNVMSAFTHGCSGAMSEQTAGMLDTFLTGLYSGYQGLTGWLGDAVNTVKESHEKFMNSRMWEFSKRINGADGKWVGAFDIGYLSDIKYQQQATGFMRNYIMANPMAMEMYLQEQISGYGGDFANLCVGVGEENFYYRQAMHGLLNYNTEENTLCRTLYNDSRNGGEHISFSNRVDIQRTWRATNQHLLAGLFDPTSIDNDDILTLEQVAERKKEAEQE